MEWWIARVQTERMMRWLGATVQGKMNRDDPDESEESEQTEVDGMKEEADAKDAVT